MKVDVIIRNGKMQYDNFDIQCQLSNKIMGVLLFLLFYISSHTASHRFAR